MRAWIANTDFEWYSFLAGRPDLDEVNFWRPSGGAFKALAGGEPLLFRLKAPYNVIAGIGFFVHFSVLPASLAWLAFGPKNGAASEVEMRARIETYRRRHGGRDERGTDLRSAASFFRSPRSSQRLTGSRSRRTGAHRRRSAASKT
jgi:putative restriction endonuclease